MTGFITQEVKAVVEDIGYDVSEAYALKNENDFYGLRYAEFIVPLVKAVQEQQTHITNLQNAKNELETRLPEQDTKLQLLQSDISALWLSVLVTPLKENK